MKSAKNPPGPVTWKRHPGRARARGAGRAQGLGDRIQGGVPAIVSSALSATNATGMSTACLSWLGITVWRRG